MIGQTLGHYRIESKLGEGGMGVVYQAHDTHLDRPVAIKVLRPGATASRERKRRFVQEAKAASALNHSSIIHVYDIDTAALPQGATDFIAMEFVAGKTLDQLGGRKGMRLGEVLKYAIQIADALACAHAAGIIHRDIKPANIMATPDGHVKILDFGLAKLAETIGGDPQAPTATIKADDAPGTEEGAIIGTVAYMSPEQGEGKKLDARSDVFSFGSVLYEMATGRRAFQGETKMSTLAAILHTEPPSIRDVAADAPRELEKIIARCLRKDPERRFQHMDDVKVALAELKEESESGKLDAAPPPARRGFSVSLRFAALTLAAVFVLVGGGWWLVGSRRPAPVGTLNFVRLTSDPGLTTDPALSPDGKLLAYASDRAGNGNLDIWVQHLPGGEPIRVTQDEADESEPAFSPDGSRIVFRSEKGIGGVYIVSSLGGEVRKVVDRGRAPGFSPDGQWLSYWEGRVTGLGGASGGLFAKSYIVPVAGGEPRELAPGFGAFYPVWSPDGKRILFVGTDPSGASDWWVMPLGGAPLRTGLAELLHSHRITQFARPAQWTEKNYVLFSSGFGDTRNIWRVSLSAGTWRATGDPERLSAGTTLEVQPAIAGNHVAVASIAENVEVWALPVDTNAARVTGDPQQLTHDLALDASPALSADGRKMAFVSARSGHTQVWFKDLTTGKEMALTATPGDKNRPQISPDGSQIIYGVTESGDGYVISSSGGIPRKACEHCGMIRNWSSDAKRILLEPGVEGRPVIALLGLDAGGRVELLRHPRQGLYSARFSPDDRWLAFAIPTAGICRLYVAPVRPSAPSQPDEWIPITDPEGWSDKPGWSPDGNTLYFLSERDGFRCLWAQKLDSGSKRPIAAPFPVYHSHSARRSVMNVPLEYLEISVARDKIAFNMGERTGNIWLATADAVK